MKCQCKESRPGTSKNSCSKGGECSCEHDPAQKGKGRGRRSRNPAPGDKSAERQHCQEDRDKAVRERKIEFRALTAREDIVVTTESVISGISRIAGIFRKMPDGQGLSVRPLPQKKERSFSPRQIGKGKEKQSATIAVVNIARQRLENTNLRNTHLKAQGNPEQVIKGILMRKRKYVQKEST